MPPHVKLDAYTDIELAKRQLVFLNGWIAPFFKAAAILFPGVRSRVEQIQVNQASCRREANMQLARIGNDVISMRKLHALTGSHSSHSTSKQTQLPPDNALCKGDAPAMSASMPARPAERQVSAEGVVTRLPLEIYTALTALDDGLVETLRAGDIRLVSSEWFLAQPDGYRIQRRQDLEALEALDSASPLLTPDEAVELIRQGTRGAASLTYGCALRDSTLRGTQRPA